MWNPRNIPKKENAPAGNKDISTLNKTYAGSGKASQTKIQSLREKAQKEWDAQELKQEKLYLTIPANVSNMRARDVQKSTGQKRSIHERLEEKKQIVEQQTKRKQRSGMEL